MNKTDQVQLGTVLFSIEEPGLGHEVEFNRWYERDHFYSGCMAGANYFSGRRWLATRRLKDLRYPQNTPLTPAIDKGSFLALYWILAGQAQSTIRWSTDQVNMLTENHRMQEPRENISTGFYHYDWGVFRDEDGVPAALALEYPYCGLAVMMVDRDKSISEEDFNLFCQEQFLPAQMSKSPIAMTLCLRPLPLPDDAPSYIPRNSSQDRASRYLFLSFLEEDPQMCWPDKFANVGIDMQGSGYAQVIYAAPFIPTVPGTDRYLDQL